MSSNIPNDNVEYRELDLSNPEDLEMFLESAEDVYADAFEYEAAAISEEYQSLKTDSLTGREVFETIDQKLATLRGLIKSCRQAVTADNAVVEDGQIDHMQQLYNELISLRNLIQDTYENFVGVPEEETSQATDEPVRLAVTSTESNNVSTETKVLEEVVVEPESQEITEPVGEEDSRSTETNLETPEEPADTTPESIEVEEVISTPVEEEQTKEDLIVSEEDLIATVAERVTKIHKDTAELFSPSEKSEEITIDLAELDVCVKRISDLKDRVEASKNANEDEVVLKNNLSRYNRVAKEIEKNANSILEVLRQKNSQGPEAEEEKVITVPDEDVLVEAKTEEPSESPKSPETPEMEEVFELTPDVRHKTMNIEPEAETEGSISIKVAKKTEQMLKQVPNPPKKPAVSQLEMAIGNPKLSVEKGSKEVELVNQVEEISNEVAIIAELEDKDVVNEAVPDKVPSIVHPQLAHEEKSLQREYLNNERYLEFIRVFHTSPAAYERILDAEVAKIEAGTVDALERFFGDKYESPFSYLQDMSVAEVIAFAARSDTRVELQANNIKYETFLTWIDLIDEMQEVVGDDPELVFGELYALWMIEAEMAYYTEQAAANSQFTV